MWSEASHDYVIVGRWLLQLFVCCRLIHRLCQEVGCVSNGGVCTSRRSTLVCMFLAAWQPLYRTLRNLGMASLANVSVRTRYKKTQERGRTIMKMVLTTIPYLSSSLSTVQGWGNHIPYIVPPVASSAKRGSQLPVPPHTFGDAYTPTVLQKTAWKTRCHTKGEDQRRRKTPPDKLPVKAYITLQYPCLELSNHATCTSLDHTDIHH